MADTYVRNLVNEVQRLANRVDTNWRTRVIEALNRALQHYAEQAPWDGLRRLESFISPGSRYLTFPSRVARPISIADLTNNRALDAGDDWARRIGEPFLAQSGSNPFEWRPAGSVPIVTSLATDTTLQLTASVSETFDVVVHGLTRDTTASGTSLELYEIKETLSMGGTGATVTSTIWADVISIQKAIDTSAALTVRASVNSAPLARLQPWEGAAEYKRVEFVHPAPAGRALQVEYFTKPEPIRSEADSIHPSVDSDYMVWRAVGDVHWLKNEQQAAIAAWTKADEMLKDKRFAELSFGEREDSAKPVLSYMDMEDEGFVD